MDVGTGSGAIAISLVVGLRRRRADSEVTVLATDVSSEALDLARENAVGHAAAERLGFLEADLLPPVVVEPYDLVLANLPYVRHDAMAGLPVAASFEPALALDGGPDGLEVIGRLLARLPESMAEGGLALLEIGADQEASIAALVDVDPAGLVMRRRARPGRPSASRASRAGDPRAGDPMNGPKTSPPLWPIRQIALDIDGTLIGDDYIIGDRTKAAIRAATGRGISVSLITGRMVSSAMRFAIQLDLTAPIVGYQGALIRAMPEPGSKRLGRLLFHRPLPAIVARDIVEWSYDQGLEPHMNHLERFIVREDDPHSDDYSAFMGAHAELVPSLLDAVSHPVTKVLAVGEPPIPTEVAPRAAAAFAGRADVTISHPRFLEFVSPGVSKGTAIRFLSRRLGIPLGATLAVGDQWNDLEMLAEVGHGAAMPTAPAAVIAAARYIAPSLEDEGVAQMIEGLVLASPASALAFSQRLEEEKAATIRAAS